MSKAIALPRQPHPFVRFLISIYVGTMLTLIDIKDWIVSAAFIPVFGIFGTDTRVGGDEGGPAFLNRMSFMCWHRVLVVEILKGKTLFVYTIVGVHPRAYLKLRRNPTGAAFNNIFITPGTYTRETVWRWRYGGSFRNDGRRARKLRKVS